MLRAICPEGRLHLTGRAEVLWGSEAPARPRGCPSQAWPHSSLSYQLHWQSQTEKGRALCWPPFQVSPSLLFLEKKELIVDFNSGVLQHAWSIVGAQ